MINSGYTNRLMGTLPEFRLVHQAKSGDINAFVELCDAYVESVYRYIHFLVPNIGVAEGLTLRVFFDAWEQLDRYRLFSPSFVVWLYSVARNQIIAYYRTHKHAVAPDNEVALAVRGGSFREDFQAIREGLQFLTQDQQHFLVLKFIIGMSNKNIARVLTRREEDVRVFQMHSLRALTGHLIKTDSKTVIKGFWGVLEDCLKEISTGAATLDECLVRYPKYAPQLGPFLETAELLVLGRGIKPLPTFDTYIHDALIQYTRSHPQHLIKIQTTVTPAIRRTALTFALLVAALFATGTVYAQSALPGEPFYPWKRTSERVWLALSPNPLAMNIILADRRLNERIAVANDPALSTSAMNNYKDALSKLDTGDKEDLALIASALQSQQEALKNAGLSSTELDNYLAGLGNEISNDSQNNSNSNSNSDSSTEARGSEANSTDPCLQEELFCGQGGYGRGNPTTESEHTNCNSASGEVDPSCNGDESNSGNSGGNNGSNPNPGNSGGNSGGNPNPGNSGGNSGGNPNPGNSGGNSGGNPNPGNSGGNSDGNPNPGNSGGNSGGNPNPGNSGGNGGGNDGGNGGGNGGNGDGNSNVP